MQDLHVIDSADQACELLKPIRIEILSRLGRPASCPEIAKQLGMTTQKINYHVKVLTEAGLVRLVEERRVRGIMEGVYQAIAKSYWFSPRLVKYLGDRKRTQDQASLAYLLQLAEDLQVDIGQIIDTSNTGSLPSLGVDANILLKDGADRSQFLEEVKDIFTRLAEKYGAKNDGQDMPEKNYRIMLACYPREEKAENNNSIE